MKAAVEVSSDEEDEEEATQEEAELEDRGEAHQEEVERGEDEPEESVVVEQCCSTLMAPIHHEEEPLEPREQVDGNKDALWWRDPSSKVGACDGEYPLDSEYFSDPDFHDERPGKTSLAARSQSEEQDSHISEPSHQQDILVEDNQQALELDSSIDGALELDTAIACASQEADNESELESSSNEPASVVDNTKEAILNDIEPTAHSKEEHLSEEHIPEEEDIPEEHTFEEHNSEFEDQVTASEARPELLVEESSAAQDDTYVHHDTSPDNSNSDRSKSPSEYPSSFCEEAATLESSDNLEDLTQHDNCLEANLLQVDSEESYAGDERECLLELCHHLTDNILEEAFLSLDTHSPAEVSTSGVVEKPSINSLLDDTGLSLPMAKQTDAPEETMDTQTHNKKLYTSSMYYDDDNETYPTIEQQVQLCRSVADSLTGQAAAPDETHMERASLMFQQRRERMRSFTLESPPRTNSNKPTLIDKIYPIEDSATRAVKRRASLDSYLPSEVEDSGQSVISCQQPPTDNLTDTEYEAPQVRHRRVQLRPPTRARKLLSPPAGQHVTTTGEPQPDPQARFKPFLDSSSLKDIARLRRRFPPGTCNEHNSVPRELCNRLASRLKSGSDSPVENSPAPSVATRVEAPQLRRCLLLESSDWILGQQQQQQQETPLPPAEEESPLQLNKPRPSLSGETVMVVEEAGEQQVVELAPPLVKHTQPQLERAQVTRTASFMSSSRLVIECDSPDLLTSRDDDDDDDGDDDDHGKDEEDKGEHLLNVARPEEHQAVPERPPPSNMHYASLLEWRPRIMTPTLMVFSVSPPEPQCGHRVWEAGGSLVASRSSSVMRDTGETGETTSAECCQPQRPFSVANMRLQYQSRLDRLQSRAYSSYRYPFARSPAHCLLAVSGGQCGERRCFSLEPPEITRAASGQPGPQKAAPGPTRQPELRATGAHLSGAELAAPVNGASDDCIGSAGARGGPWPAATTRRPESVCGAAREPAGACSRSTCSHGQPRPQGRQQVPTEWPQAAAPALSAHLAQQQQPHAFAAAPQPCHYPSSGPATPGQHWRRALNLCAGPPAEPQVTTAPPPQHPPDRAQEAHLAAPLNRRRSEEALRAVLVARPRVNYCAIINRCG